MKCPICGSARYSETATAYENSRGEIIVNTSGECDSCGYMNASAIKVLALTLAEVKAKLAENDA